MIPVTSDGISFTLTLARRRLPDSLKTWCLPYNRMKPTEYCRMKMLPEVVSRAVLRPIAQRLKMGHSQGGTRGLETLKHPAQ